jgi:tRNA pseudouridine38-40 synthase
MKRYFMELSFEGTKYHGWQVQPNARTVQETIESGLSILLKNQINLTGAGRTDTGVHALFFVAHFELDTLQIIQPENLVYKLNRFLPDDIVIHSIYEVDQLMHARYSAKYRKYKYVIKSLKPIFNRPFCSYYFGDLDIGLMNQACTVLLEYTDFTSFSKLHTDVKSNNCKIIEAIWIQQKDGIDFEIKADRFLRNMVRSIVGTMLEVGSGKMSIKEFRDVIEAKDRAEAGMSAEARGLTLVDIGY